MRAYRPARRAALACLALAATVAAGSSTETAVANGDTRTLHFRHSHTGETIDATFRVNGAYDPAVLSRLNHFLRDWRNDEETRMDPRLFDAVWEAYRTAGVVDREISIVSAYRSPRTNAMLRSRSRASGVAEHSQHILGKAMDTTMPGMSMERIREVGMRLQNGGVGYYQTSNFVHLDVGNVRSWPRMSRDMLVRLFPDGKTAHLPASGPPLARFAEAKAEIEARGNGVDTRSIDEPNEGAVAQVAAVPESRGFLASLFGGPDPAATQAMAYAETGRMTAIPAAAIPVPSPAAVDPARVAALGGPAFDYSRPGLLPPGLLSRPANAYAPPAPIPTPVPVRQAMPLAPYVPRVSVVAPIPPRRPYAVAPLPVRDAPIPALPGTAPVSGDVRFSDALDPYGVPSIVVGGYPAPALVGDTRWAADATGFLGSIEPDERDVRYAYVAGPRVVGLRAAVQEAKATIERF